MSPSANRRTWPMGLARPAEAAADEGGDLADAAEGIHVDLVEREPDPELLLQADEELHEGERVEQPELEEVVVLGGHVEAQAQAKQPGEALLHRRLRLLAGRGPRAHRANTWRTAGRST